jgi:hypothetical protein
MKSWIAVWLVGCMVCSGVMAEGTLNFANGAAGVNAPVTDSGGSRLSGPDWSATLLHLREEGEPVPVAGPVALGEGDLAGYFLGGTVVLEEASPRSKATFQVRISDASGTAKAVSDSVTIELGGDLYPPANLVGLNPIEVAGEAQSELELRVNPLAEHIELAWPAEHSGAQLESTDTLKPPQWAPVETDASLNGGFRVLDLPANEERQFYRLRKVTE